MLQAGFLAVRRAELPAAGGQRWWPPCVAVSPGGPTHVLLNDEVAEHIPGCNMAFRREVLEEIGGFDPIYRAAGDDVDICWRLQDARLHASASARPRWSGISAATP